jgi:hypothetical protein
MTMWGGRGLWYVIVYCTTKCSFPKQWVALKRAGSLVLLMMMMSGYVAGWCCGRRAEVILTVAL